MERIQRLELGLRVGFGGLGRGIRFDLFRFGLCFVVFVALLVSFRWVGLGWDEWEEYIAYRQFCGSEVSFVRNEAICIHCIALHRRR